MKRAVEWFLENVVILGFGLMGLGVIVGITVALAALAQGWGVALGTLVFLGYLSLIVGVIRGNS